MQAIFRKSVSKGSRFNQIYVPRNMENLIEVGDEVEVKLIKKCARLHYSNAEKLSEFKESLLKEIFSYLDEIADTSYIFAVGSFLTEKISYNDIDIVLIAPEAISEKTVYDKLTDKFNLKFHIISIEEKGFERLLKICPLTRAMFSRFVSNKPLAVPMEKLVDNKHLQFLLMMPQDLLDIKLSSRAFFDNIRRLVTIERFLIDKDLDMISINKELKDMINLPLYYKIKNNDGIEDATIDFLRKIIKAKLAIILKHLKNGKK